MSANTALELIYRRNLQQRLQFFRAIFEELKGREFGVHDVAKVISMSRNATITYRRELLEAGVMHKTDTTKGNCCWFRLTDKQEDIDAFLELVAEGARMVAPRVKARPKLAPVPAPRKPFVAFRHWMDVALFGPARAAGAA